MTPDTYYFHRTKCISSYSQEVMMATLFWTVWSVMTLRQTPGRRWHTWRQVGAASVWPLPWSRARKTYHSVRILRGRTALCYLPISPPTPVLALITISSTEGSSAKAHDAHLKTLSHTHTKEEHSAPQNEDLSWLETDVLRHILLPHWFIEMMLNMIFYKSSAMIATIWQKGCVLKKAHSSIDS